MSLTIYVITLKRTPERRLYVQRQLDALGLDYQMVYGIDRHDLLSKEYRMELAQQLGMSESDMEYRYQDDIKQPQPALAVLLSHLKIYDLMIKDKIPQACILEDDIVVSPIFPKILANIQKFSWDMVLLSNQSDFNRLLAECLVDYSEIKSEFFDILEKVKEHRKKYPQIKRLSAHQNMEIVKLIFYMTKRYWSHILGNKFKLLRALPFGLYEKHRIGEYYSCSLGALPVPDKSSWLKVIDNYYLAQPFEATSSAMAYLLNLDVAIKYKEMVLRSPERHIDDIPWHLFTEQAMRLLIMTPPCIKANCEYLYYSPRRCVPDEHQRY